MVYFAPMKIEFGIAFARVPTDFQDALRTGIVGEAHSFAQLDCTLDDLKLDYVCTSLPNSSMPPKDAR